MNLMLSTEVTRFVKLHLIKNELPNAKYIKGG